MSLFRPEWLFLLAAGACSHQAAPTALQPATGPSQLVVRMVDMTNLALEWEFFDSHSDSIGAGTITARGASWCAKVAVPTGAETARLFNGLEDLALSPASHPYWTLYMRQGNEFVPEVKPPC